MLICPHWGSVRFGWYRKTHCVPMSSWAMSYLLICKQCNPLKIITSWWLRNFNVWWWHSCQLWKCHCFVIVVHAYLLLWHINDMHCFIRITISVSTRNLYCICLQYLLLVNWRRHYDSVGSCTDFIGCQNKMIFLLRKGQTSCAFCCVTLNNIRSMLKKLWALTRRQRLREMI